MDVCGRYSAWLCSSRSARRDRVAQGDALLLRRAVAEHQREHAAGRDQARVVRGARVAQGGGQGVHVGQLLGAQSRLDVGERAHDAFVLVRRVAAGLLRRPGTAANGHQRLPRRPSLRVQQHVQHRLALLGVRAHRAQELVQQIGATVHHDAQHEGRRVAEAVAPVALVLAVEQREQHRFERARDRAPRHERERAREGRVPLGLAGVEAQPVARAQRVPGQRQERVRLLIGRQAAPIGQHHVARAQAGQHRDPARGEPVVAAAHLDVEPPGLVFGDQVADQQIALFARREHRAVEAPLREAHDLVGLPRADHVRDEPVEKTGDQASLLVAAGGLARGDHVPAQPGDAVLRADAAVERERDDVRARCRRDGVGRDVGIARQVGRAQHGGDTGRIRRARSARCDRDRLRGRDRLVARRAGDPPPTARDEHEQQQREQPDEARRHAGLRRSR
jgi:hypothetical protein